MRIFIAHASEQKDDAEQVALSLTQDGHTVFLDRTKLHDGEGYDRKIREELRRTDLLIYLLSPESVDAGSYSLTELEIYKSFVPKPSGRVLPVVLAETDAIPPYLSAVTYCERKGNLAADVSFAVSNISARRNKRFGLWLSAAVAILAVGFFVAFRLTRANPAKPSLVTSIASKSFVLYSKAEINSVILQPVASGTQLSVENPKDTPGWVKLTLPNQVVGWAPVKDVGIVSVVGVKYGYGYQGSFWQVYFTEPVFSKRTDKTAPPGYGIDIRFVEAIQKCEKSLDIAVFEINSPAIIDAIVEAKKKNIAVRVVANDDPNPLSTTTRKSIEALRNAGINVVVNQSRSRLMHDKFAIIDNLRVWTGSWNYTTGATFGNNDHALVLENVEIAKAFTAAFDDMYRDIGHNPPIWPKPSQGAHPARQLPFGVSALFAPQDSALDSVKEVVMNAKHSIKFMIFSLTDAEFAESLASKASEGVKVEGILEKSLARGLGSKKLMEDNIANLAIRVDGNPRNLHHNSLIVDDSIVVTGSSNYSKHGRTNYENVVIVPDAALAAVFSGEFERLWAKATKPKPSPGP